MGFWLRDRIKTWTNVTDTDTQRLELPTSGIISAIQIKVTATRSATARTANTACVHIADDMDKLAVIESGEKVLKAVNGQVLLAHNLMDFKRPAYQQYSEWASDTNIDNYFLLFGRSIGDKEYALDLSKHKDVRLEIEHSFDTTTSVGWTTTVQDIDVWIWRYIDPDFFPVGYLKTSEKFHYTASGTAGEVRNELPCLNPYRRILMRTFLTTKTPGACLTDVTLVVNDGAYEPFFGIPMDMANADVVTRGLYPMWLGETFLYASATAYTESHIPYNYGMLANYNTKSNANPEGSFLQTIAGGRVTLTETDAVTAQGVLRVEGSAYQEVISVPWDIPDIEDTYFKSGSVDKVELVLNHLGVQADTRIVLDELVKY